LTTETNAAYKGAAPPAAAAGTAPAAAAGDWPSYNKTLTSERFSSLSQINTQNVAKLKVLGSYDTRQFTSFETGPIMVEGALIGRTEFDIFSLDPATCAENWRTHEDYPGLHSADEPGRGLPGRYAVSRDRGRAGACLRLQGRPAALGDHDR